MPLVVKWSLKPLPGISMELLAARISGAKFRQFMTLLGNDAVAQVRKNILEQGGPGGSWPPLSDAYAAHKERLMGMRNEMAAKLPAMTAVMEGRNLGRKEMVKFGGDVRLRATGAMYEGIKAKLFNRGKGVRVTSDGQLAGRPSNADLLVWNATGAGGAPRRDPTQNMDRFLARWHARLLDYVKTGRLDP